MLYFTIFIIILALLFDFLNGMNDAANSIATIVSTRVLSPRTAVLWAAFFNFAAAFGFGVHVATTIGKGIVETQIVDHILILSTLIGGLAGSAVMKAGFSALVAPGLIKVSIFIFLSPIIGFLLGVVLTVVITWIFRNWRPRKVDKVFRVGQLLSSAAFSIGHGTNDAQKTMGIIAILLFSGGYLGNEFYVPFWVIIISYAAISAGTLAGGWKVIRTMGMRLTHLKPIGGFCAETSGAIVLISTAAAGIPVSTTHTVAGAIMGVGATKRLSAVKWGIAGKIVWAWVLTIPFSALCGGLAYWIIKLFI